MQDMRQLTPPVEDFLIAEDPFYLPVGEEVELFTHAWQAQIPVILKGPTGCGKTRFVSHMAHKLGRPLITVACHEDLTASDLVGRFLLQGDETLWVDGPMTAAVRHGGILYLDEIVEARKDTMVVIHPLTDHRRVLTIDKLAQVLRAPPEFMLVISYNPGYQSVLKEMKQSTRAAVRLAGLQLPSGEHRAAGHPQGGPGRSGRRPPPGQDRREDPQPHQPRSGGGRLHAPAHPRRPPHRQRLVRRHRLRRRLRPHPHRRRRPPALHPAGRRRLLLSPALYHTTASPSGSPQDIPDPCRWGGEVRPCFCRCS